MEHRRDLEEILLAGLPVFERKQVIETIRDHDQAKFERKRLQRDPDRSIDLVDALEADGAPLF